MRKIPRCMGLRASVMTVSLFGPTYRSTGVRTVRPLLPAANTQTERKQERVLSLPPAARARPNAKSAIASPTTATATGTNGTSSSCPRCAGEWPLPCVLRRSAPTSAGRQRPSHPSAHLCAPVPSRCFSPCPSRSSCRRRTSCSRSPRPAAPLPSATRRASRSPPLCGVPAAAAWPCTPTCHRVASRSPDLSSRPTSCPTEAGAVKGVTLEKGGWNGRTRARSREMI